MLTRRMATNLNANPGVAPAAVPPVPVAPPAVPPVPVPPGGGAPAPGGGAPAPGGGGGPAIINPRPAPVFALTPALLNVGFLDWSKSENVKLYTKAIEKLDVKFEGKPDQVILLAQATQNRAGLYGFDRTIMNIPDSTGVPRNIITEHGLLSYDDIKAWAATSIVGQQTRAAQDNMMLYQCLLNSASEDVKKKLIPKSKDHKADETYIAAMYYKGLISTVEVETKATVAFIRTKLTNLKGKIKSLNYDIDLFHAYVEQQVTSLASHGKISEDLTVYLFQAYETVPDEDFNKILKMKQSDYHMGITDLESKDLINYAQKCFDVRSTNTESPWLQKSKEVIEFEAMTATMETMKADNLKLTKALKSTNKMKGKVKKGDGSKGEFKPRANTGKYAWKDVAPKPGEDLTKKKGDKNYNWCPHHKQWTLHKPDDCKLKDGKTAFPAETPDESRDDDDDDNSNVSVEENKAKMKSFLAACNING